MDRMRNDTPNAEGERPAAFVTGAAGFIGAAVCRRLLALGWQVYAVIRQGSNRERLPARHPSLMLVEGDLMRLPKWEAKLEEAVQRRGPAAVWLHLGWTGVAGADRNDEAQNDNVAAVLQSVRTAAKLGCRSWIGAGSQAEYGRLEGRADEGTSELPTTVYGKAKLAAGREALAEAKRLGLAGSWVRIFSVYGPGDNGGWLIPDIARKLLAGQSPELTLGEQRWDYLYIDDAADAFAALAQRSITAPYSVKPLNAAGQQAVHPAAGVFNLGSGESRTIREIAELVRTEAARWLPPDLPQNGEARTSDHDNGGSLDRLVPPLQLGAVPYRDDQVMLLEAEAAKLRSITGWKPRIPLEEGIRRTVAAIAKQFAQERRLAIKRSIVTMAYRSGASHVGAALSVADILLVLYCRVMRVNPADADAPYRDKLVFSKAHASTALYAILAERGFMPTSRLDGYSVDGGTLPGHLDRRSAPGIDVSAGSLGHGLSIATGLALADRLAGRDSRTFAVLGDGECNEGSVWEAALLASAQKLDGLTAVVDCNGWQGFGRTDELAPLTALGDKWRAFGWEAVEVDGHDEEALYRALSKRGTEGRPKVVIARTIKGHGVDYMADTLEWHYKSPSAEQWYDAMRQLGSGEGSG
ncbi:NAD-dependent epimerase/dehydratase family protein [Paenibacillus xylaniclasticus]|uniref:NAD-dependent epimerase/dehydratase family protein n=1 Tax=Paenibacillus xylaniclasticus TaxID=588083 RepID=UPI000FDAF118|nr:MULTISPECIES: NAD-dependent epimerase/dehydratase family protein [Paenibacillus]GFN31958.1 hypothetical protein PCURB6_22180 [Paenibacillus curdlanolyticus]